MSLLKLHRALIATATTLCCLFFLHHLLRLTRGEGYLLVLLGTGIVGASLFRYFLYLRAKGLPGLSGGGSEGSTSSPADEPVP